ncbi:MAG: DUF86 domain-containing protein [Deltaproteobacteria bacterium]|jgi:uncharacterized protein with HEPN domain|nr:DUF86 domain-containing protein [Deltaproteobacteria bacterium]
MSNLDLQIHKLLDDIYTSASRIVERLHNETREGFLSAGGMDVQDIVARRLTIIGEASTALLKKHPEFCEQNKHIPLRQARGMRNALVHDYDSIKWDLVWDTAQKELPKLIESIAPLLGKNS